MKPKDLNEEVCNPSGIVSTGIVSHHPPPQVKLARSFAESSRRNLVLDCEHGKSLTDDLEICCGRLFHRQDHRTATVEISR